MYPNFKILLLLILVLFFTRVKGQDTMDFVVLRSEKNLLNNDTIFGMIEMPHKGVFWNVKIKTNSGKRKFKTKEVKGLKAGNLYFASIPYGKSNAIVPRIIQGKIDLYFYYTGSDRLSFIPKMQEEYKPIKNVSFYTPVAISNAIWDATSNFYILDPSSNKYLKIPRSKDKFIEQISFVFKSNEEIYNKIITGEYDPIQIGKIVNLFNNYEEN